MFPKAFTKLYNPIFKIYILVFTFFVIGSIYQLINPKIPKITDSSGLGILQDFYLWGLFFYFVTATFLGILALFWLFKEKLLKTKLTFLSLILLFNFPIFILFFIETGQFIRHYFGNWLELNGVKMHQEAVFISLFLVIFQLYVVIFLNNHLKFISKN